jgi:catechol 2,3-dioxygenase-like lactoylglutathione lyase family enzyme
MDYTFVRQRGAYLMSIIDHLSLMVSDYARSRAFYQKALDPLGIHVIMEAGPTCGFGRDAMPVFWIGSGPASFQKPEHLNPITPNHIAFSARSRAEVDAFHRAALEAGAKDNGGPGLRPEYHSMYYAAFVLDPDGHNIEAVTHRADLTAG